MVVVVVDDDVDVVAVAVAMAVAVVAVVAVAVVVVDVALWSRRLCTRSRPKGLPEELQLPKGLPCLG